MLELIHNITTVQWLTLLACAFLIGAAKTGVPGFGVLVVPLMAMVFPSRASTGILLGILITADVFAAFFYRYAIQWRLIGRLLPGTLLGVLLGAAVMNIISDAQLQPFIGGIVLMMLAVRYVSVLLPAGTRENLDTMKTHWLTSLGFGGLAGFTSMLANAAGPVMSMYLLSLRLDKTRFVGANVWFFFILNWLKVPFSAGQNLINAQSLMIDVVAIPAIAIGAWMGLWVLRKIPQKAFETLVVLLTLAAAIKLLF